MSEGKARSGQVFEIVRLSDPARAEELLSFVPGSFQDLPIEPPSSVVKETPADFERRIRQDIVFTAEAEAALIGCVFGSPKVDTLYIGRLAVRPDWRRRGVAGALIDTARVQARRLGFRKMALGARIALPGNVRLFQRHGFAVTAVRCHAGFTVPTSYDMELSLY